MEEIAFDLIETEDIEEIMDEIMKRYGQEVIQLVYSYVNNQAIAEDLTQEIFVKCYKAFPSFKGKSKLKTWLWRIAINHCKDYLKSWYNKNVVISEKDSTNNGTQKETIEQAVIQKEEEERLALEVMSLPIKYREVIYLFYFEERAIKEIAAVIGVKENTIKTRLRRAKELLKERLED